MPSVTLPARGIVPVATAALALPARRPAYSVLGSERGWLLPRLVGRARASEMLLLGEKVPAVKAQEWGLIHRCLADDALESEAAAESSTGSRCGRVRWSRQWAGEARGRCSTAGRTTGQDQRAGSKGRTNGQDQRAAEVPQVVLTQAEVPQQQQQRAEE